MIFFPPHLVFSFPEKWVWFWRSWEKISAKFTTEEAMHASFITFVICCCYLLLTHIIHLAQANQLRMLKTILIWLFSWRRNDQYIDSMGGVRWILDSIARSSDADHDDKIEHSGTHRVGKACDFLCWVIVSIWLWK